MLFGKKKGGEKTVLIVDVENGSVGAALTRLSPQEPPKVFSQKRVFLSPEPTRHSGSLVPRIDTAVQGVLQHIAHVAARIRLHPPAKEVGEVSHVVFFLHAPWVMVEVIGAGKVSLEAHDDFLALLRNRAREVFDGVPLSFQAYGSRVPGIVSNMFTSSDETLLLTITGEVIELSKTYRGELFGHATIPHGLHTFVRTLCTHTGMSEAEARSALVLMRHKNADKETPWGEAIRTAAGQVMEESRDVFTKLIGEQAAPHGIYILAPAPLAEWFAEAVTEDESLADIFPEGSIARAVHAHHAKPFLSMYSHAPDVPLVLETLSTDARLRYT